ASLVGSATSDASGGFRAIISVPPSSTPGVHPVTATGVSSGLTASASFLVRTDRPGFHFDRANTGHNLYENVLNPSNVHSMVKLWSFTTPRAVESGPAVVHGVVYVGS